MKTIDPRDSRPPSATDIAIVASVVALWMTLMFMVFWAVFA